jgi:type IV pilus assembly protein PilM
MAVKIRNCLGIDIGSHSMRIANMEMGRAGPRVVALYEEPLVQEGDLTEAQRAQRQAKQLSDLLKRNKIRTKNAVFCVPGQTVFVRRFTLPLASPERMNRMVRFEARQLIPFPLDKTIMEYQIFDEDDAAQVQVLLVAIKKEFILHFMRMVKRSGLSALAISVSTLALYNFHELNSSDRDLLEAQTAGKKDKKANAGKTKGKKKKSASDDTGDESGIEDEMDGGADAAVEGLAYEEVQAYVNLGASLMDIVIPKPGKARMLGFPRSVPLAGNQMDQAVQERLGLDEIAKARSIKENKVAILGSDFEMEGDADSFNMDASEAVTAVADRLVSELRRSLDYYISQPDGVAVDSVVLSGGLARIPFLINYIEEKMGLPVSISEPRHPQLRLPDPAPEDMAGYAVAIGLGLQGLGLSQNQINFLPEDIKVVRGLQEKKFELAGMFLMLSVLIGLSFGVGDQSREEYKAGVENLRKIQRMRSKDDLVIKDAESRDKKVATAYTKLASAAGSRDFWFQFLQMFLEQRPPDVLIDEIEMRLDGNVRVEGRAIARPALTTFMKNLEADDSVVKAQMVGMEPVRDRRFTSRVWHFEFTLKTFRRSGRLRYIEGYEPPLETLRTGSGNTLFSKMGTNR